MLPWGGQGAVLNCRSRVDFATAGGTGNHLRNSPAEMSKDKAPRVGTVTWGRKKGQVLDRKNSSISNPPKGQ